jgi:HK97 family phage portal protein
MIISTRNRGQVELRNLGLLDLIPYGMGGNLREVTGTQAVSDRSAHGIPALHRAARLRAEALASLKLKCWSGTGPDRVHQEGSWQDKFFAGRANEDQTRFGFWETIGESLAWRNNAYIWKNVDPLTGRPVDWYALHPDQVLCDDDGYTVTVTKFSVDPVGRGPAKYQVDNQTILHIRGYGDGGMYEASSPIQVFRDALASPVLRQRHEARMWSRGATLQAAVVFPAGMRQEDAERWKDKFKELHTGADGDTMIVVGGGAEIKPIGMTVADSKFVEMAHLTVEDASRIMGVPANLLGAPTMTGTQRANLEEDLATWFRFGLGPELERIESVLSVDPNLFPAAGRQVYPSFDADQFVRGDLVTEATILVSRVQAGIITPDEARQTLGYAPHPGGVGQIPQITPVGGAPNPLPPVKPTEKPAQGLNSRTALEGRSGANGAAMSQREAQRQLAQRMEGEK